MNAVICRITKCDPCLQATIELRFPVNQRSSEAQQLIDGNFKVMEAHTPVGLS